MSIKYTRRPLPPHGESTTAHRQAPSQILHAITRILYPIVTA